MVFILIALLIIVAIILLILKKKNVITLKNIIIILLIFLLLYGCFKIFVKRHDIIFFFQSLEYENVDKYDYSNDVANNGYISKEGAIKIAREKTNKKRIADVTCELVENGIYYTSNSKKQATFWSITLTTGWDSSCGHEEKWYFYIDYYTGEILQWDVMK